MAGRRTCAVFSDSPDGAWAEFLRHEGIAQESELANVRRAPWAIEMPDDLAVESPHLVKVLTGEAGTSQKCRRRGDCARKE
jgi:hypothetical protein